MHLYFGIGGLSIRIVPGATTRGTVGARAASQSFRPNSKARYSKVQGFHLRGNVRFHKTGRVLDDPLFRVPVKTRLSSAACL